MTCVSQWGKTLIVAGLVVGWIGTAQGVSDEDKCQAGRLKAKGKYEQCVQKWLAKAYGGKGIDKAKLAKCRITYAGAWTKLQALTLSTTCILARFVDNGTTVTDNLTGLVWEKKTTAVGSGWSPADPHDVDHNYTWANALPYINEDGTTYTEFLTNLNAGGGFASANGWRLPTLAELGTILLPEEYPCTSNPCIDSIFGATQSFYLGYEMYYWSATTHAAYPGDAWFVCFGNGNVDYYGKPYPFYVRAVRDGL